MTSVVMTGRRMHSSDRRMAPLPCLTAAVRALLFGGWGVARRSTRLLHTHADPARQSDLAVRDNALTGLEAVAQVGGLANNALDEHRAGGNLVVGTYDPGNHALLRRQDRRGRHRQHAPLRFDRQGYL